MIVGVKSRRGKMVSQESSGGEPQKGREKSLPVKNGRAGIRPGSGVKASLSLSFPIRKVEVTTTLVVWYLTPTYHPDMGAVR